MKKRNTNKKKGFTLIELVVVIAIIGILAAVITPRIRLSLYKARDSRAVASLDALRTASNVYFAEKGTPIGVAGTDETLLTKQIVWNLQEAGYLDTQSGKKLGAADGDDTAVVIETGVAVVDASCAKGTTPDALAGAKLTVTLEKDGVGMKFGGADDGTGTDVVDIDENLIDTTCNPWSEK